MPPRIPPNRKEIGRVVSAEWNAKTNAIDFVIQFIEGGWRIAGSCPSGYDPATGTFASKDALRKRVEQVRNMVVYDNTGRMNPARMTHEQISRLSLDMSLSGTGINVKYKQDPPSANTFLSRILR